MSGVVEDVAGRLGFESNSSTVIRSMALSSLGVAVLPAWMIEEDIASGSLHRLLPDYSLPRQSISIVFPNGGHLPHKSRVFIDFLCDRLGAF